MLPFMIELTFIALEFCDFGSGDGAADELLSFICAFWMHTNGFVLWLICCCWVPLLPLVSISCSPIFTDSISFVAFFLIIFLVHRIEMLFLNYIYRKHIYTHTRRDHLFTKLFFGYFFFFELTESSKLIFVQLNLFYWFYFCINFYIMSTRILRISKFMTWFIQLLKPLLLLLSYTKISYVIRLFNAFEFYFTFFCCCCFHLFEGSMFTFYNKNCLLTVASGSVIEMHEFLWKKKKITRKN